METNLIFSGLSFSIYWTLITEAMVRNSSQDSFSTDGSNRGQLVPVVMGCLMEYFTKCLFEIIWCHQTALVALSYPRDSCDATIPLCSFQNWRQILDTCNAILVLLHGFYSMRGPCLKSLVMNNEYKIQKTVKENVARRNIKSLFGGMDTFQTTEAHSSALLHH